MTDEHTMPTPTRFRAAGDRAAARLRKRAEWAFTAAQRRAAHDLAYEQWATGALAPYRITRALDAAELYGPDVDIACGAQEPAVDEWEAGTRYPSFEQLLALAALTHQSPDSFTARDGDEDLDLFRHHDVVPHQQSRARPMATPDHRIRRRSRRRMSRHQRIPRHPPVLTCPHETEKNHEAPGTRRPRVVGEVIAQFRVLVLIDIVMVAVFAGLFMQPRYVPREPAPECYTTLLGSTGAPQCPTAAHNFMMTYSPVIMAILVGVVLLSTHIRVFRDHRNRPAREISQEESA